MVVLLSCSSWDETRLSHWSVLWGHQEYKQTSLLQKYVLLCCVAEWLVAGFYMSLWRTAPSPSVAQPTINIYEAHVGSWLSRLHDNWKLWPGTSSHKTHSKVKGGQTTWDTKVEEKRRGNVWSMQVWSYGSLILGRLILNSNKSAWVLVVCQIQYVGR